MSAGRVGRAHGRDGSFYVESPAHGLPQRSEVVIRGQRHRVERRGGTDERPLVRLSGVQDPRPLRGEPLLVESELEEGEYLAGALAGCRVEGLGSDARRVKRVLAGPTCSVLELEGGALVPLVSDAIRSVDLERRLIEVEGEFLQS